ncbi:MAG: AAA domain-containing protein, partial [Chloroflexota bacterium]
EIKRRLPLEARVGTVDKFQGQEAPVSIYSMTTSTPELAPRGMTFLYSRHRLNVATSRARCVAVVVASPALFRVSARTPEQMRLANAFCRFDELAHRHS